MASVYSKRLADLVASGAGTHTLYTAPSGITAVVRDITGFCNSSGGGFAVINSPSATAWWSGNTTAQFTYFHEECRKIVGSLEVITFQVVSGSWTISLSGYELRP